MDNMINVYTRLKMRKDSTIVVNYYDKDGMHTTEGRFVNIFRFDNVSVGSIHNKIMFFDPNSMIKSITLKDTGSVLYYNPYVSDYIFRDGPIDSYKIKYYKESLFNNIDMDQIITRDYFLRNFLSNNRKIYLEDIFLTKKQENLFYPYFTDIIKSLKKYSNKNNIDDTFRYIGCGRTSITYGVGDKIIKIGKPRDKATIPYCEYLLQPIINKIFYFDDIPIHIEINERVLMLSDIKSDKNSKKLFVYLRDMMNLDLRSKGIKLLDDHLGNVGILLKDNVIHYDSIKFDVSSEEMSSILYNNSNKILHKGDMVITDLDSIEIEDYDKYDKYLKSIGYEKKYKKISVNMI